MDERALLGTLYHLAQIDIDAIGAYTRAIENCRDEGITRMLSRFRDDHRRHVHDLSGPIRRLGGTPPQAPDFSGAAIEGFTAMVSSTGWPGALMAMESNEVVTNDAYRQALCHDFPGNVRSVVQRNFADEQRHLDAIRARFEAAVPGGPMLSQAAIAQGWMTAFWVNGPPASYFPRQRAMRGRITEPTTQPR